MGYTVLSRNDSRKSSRPSSHVRKGPNTAIRQVPAPPCSQEHAATVRGLCRDCRRVAISEILRCCGAAWAAVRPTSLQAHGDVRLPLPP